MLSATVWLSMGSAMAPRLPAGTSQDEWVREVGWPTGRSSAGNREVWVYPNFRVVFEQGRVQHVQPAVAGNTIHATTDASGPQPAVTPFHPGVVTARADAPVANTGPSPALAAPWVYWAKRLGPLALIGALLLYWWFRYRHVTPSTAPSVEMAAPEATVSLSAQQLASLGAPQLRTLGLLLLRQDGWFPGQPPSAATTRGRDDESWLSDASGNRALLRPCAAPAILDGACVRDLAATMALEGCTKAWIVTTSEASASALKLAAGHGIAVLAHHQLADAVSALPAAERERLLQALTAPAPARGATLSPAPLARPPALVS